MMNNQDDPQEVTQLTTELAADLLNQAGSKADQSNVAHYFSKMQYFCQNFCQQRLHQQMQEASEAQKAELSQESLDGFEMQCN